MKISILFTKIFSTSLRVFLLAALLIALLPAAPVAAQSGADGFIPGANDIVFALALQPDGKILVGGLFTELAGQPHNRIGRLNPDGSLDSTFDTGAGAHGPVHALALQPDGAILVGGYFTTIDGQTRNRIARLNPDGSLDTGFNPGANGSVLALALQPDGKILVGGEFTTLGGQTRNRIARLNPDGSLDSTFDTGTGANWIVYSLALQPDGAILVGGDFTTLDDQTHNRIARLNPNGSLDSTFNIGTGANDIVLAFALQPDGKILVGGWFTTLGGQTRNYFARLFPNGDLDLDFNPGATSAVNTLALQPDGKILVGGGFTILGGQPRAKIGRLHPDGNLDTGFNPGADGDVFALSAQPDGKILVGGSFTTLGGATRANIGRLYPNGGLDTDLNPEANSNVLSIAVQSDGKILVGGDFSAMGGVLRNSIARLNPNGDVDLDFNPNANSTVFALSQQPDGKILAGGFFTAMGGQTRNYIARLNPNGDLDTDFNPDANGEIYTLALQPNGKILVGGSFTTMGGQTRNYIARLLPNGDLDTDFDPGATSSVYTLALQPDGKILVGGAFTLLGGGNRGRIARLNPNGSLDLDFNPVASFVISTLALQPDGAILVGGLFTSIDGETRNHIARLLPNGDLDLDFNPGADAAVQSLALQPDGKILVGGWFTTLGGQPRNRLGRLSSTEAALQTLDTDGAQITWMRSGAGPEVWRVAFESSTDGVNFTSLGDASRIPGGWALSGLSLPHGVNIFIRARGYYSTGAYNSSGSILDSVRLVFLAPAPFSKSQPSDTASNQPLDPTLTWAGSDGAGSYEYCLDTSDNDTCDTGWVSVANTTSAGLAGLSASTTYFWQVRALNPAGTTSADNGAWWSFTTAVKVVEPVAPAAFSKTQPSNTASNLPLDPTLSWEASDRADSYEYCLDTSDNDSCDTGWVSVGSTTSANLAGLSASTTYSWQVRALNPAGSTSADNGTWWSFTTAAEVIEPKPDFSVFLPLITN